MLFRSNLFFLFLAALIVTAVVADANSSEEKDDSLEKDGRELIKEMTELETKLKKIDYKTMSPEFRSKMASLSETLKEKANAIHELTKETKESQ